MTQCCILNVATDQFVANQQRLVRSLRAVNWDGPIVMWTNKWPAGSPAHSAVPYGFKYWAITEAWLMGYQQCLWVDAAFEFVEHPKEMIDMIDRRGYLFFEWPTSLVIHVASEVLERHKISRAQAQDMDLLVGGCFGVNSANDDAVRWVQGMMDSASNGEFSNNGTHRHDEAVGRCWIHTLGLTMESPDMLCKVTQRSNQADPL